MADTLAIQQDFNQLNVKDLLEARDLYHVHLMHKQNVVATAIGRYLMRNTESSHGSGKIAGAGAPKSNSALKPRPPKTLANSSIQDSSWPCVLVFVSQWVDPSSFGHGKGKWDPQNFVPPTIYMPDGRAVPVCVVLTELDQTDPGPVSELTFPSSLIGGGYPIVMNVQGQEHVASVGCLVTDGHLVYALTNRHVAGAPGERVFSILNGQRVEIGIASDKQLQRKPFQDVYSEWPGKNVYVNLDIGLVEVLDKTRWTAQIYGIGTMGNLADLSPENISLKLIDSKVRAFGCASGGMYGAICGLFYRYKAVGGFEYMADLLIGARNEKRENSPGGKDGNSSGKSRQPKPFATHPGDSGTIWLLETDDERGLMPLAVQWGGHVFLQGANASRMRFALSTCLSTVCNQLGVDVIRDWNIGAPEYWGAVGHYTIAGKAIDLLPEGALKNWMILNRDLITYPTKQVVDKTMKGLSTRPFVPLADVPDMVWKVGPHKRGGMKSPEHSNHFADMDQPRPGDGKTLLELCESDPDRYVSVREWQMYYDAVHDESRGLLPFRVWQIWDAMVRSASANDIASFICAAGILAHYVGDSCQPLHISFRFNGDPDRKVPTQVKDRDTKKWVEKDMPAGTGVHSAYEDAMVNFHINDINAGLMASGSVGASGVRPATSGHEAAKAVVVLMQQTFNAIQPLDIVNAFIAAQQKQLKPHQIADELWKSFGKATITVMLDGSRVLSQLWQSAWNAGQGNRSAAPRQLSQDDMVKLYTNPAFLPSHTLDTISQELSGSGAATTSRSNANARTSTGPARNGSRSRARPHRTRSKHPSGA